MRLLGRRVGEIAPDGEVRWDPPPTRSHAKQRSTRRANLTNPIDPGKRRQQSERRCIHSSKSIHQIPLLGKQPQVAGKTVTESYERDAGNFRPDETAITKRKASRESYQLLIRGMNGGRGKLGVPEGGELGESDLPESRIQKQGPDTNNEGNSPTTNPLPDPENVGHEPASGSVPQTGQNSEKKDDSWIKTQTAKGITVPRKDNDVKMEFKPQRDEAFRKGYQAVDSRRIPMQLMQLHLESLLRGRGNMGT